MATTVAYALLISALLVASSVLLHAAHGDTAGMVGTIGLVGFLLAGFLSVGLIWDIWRTRRGVTRSVREEEREERKLHG